MKANNHQPPQWAVRFFHWYCNDHLADAAFGDILEMYHRRCASIGKRKADVLFVWNVIQFFQPFAFRKRTQFNTPNQFTMFRNYFIIAWRSMGRQKMYSSIKVGGLALGLATCILIALFIRHELNYDTHYIDGDRIYRVLNNYKGPVDGGRWTAFPASAAGILKNEYPEVEKSGRLIPYDWYNAGSNLVRSEDKTENTYEEGFAYADQSLLEILEIPMIYGSTNTALAKPNSVVISQRKADQYFPGENPVGKTIILNEDRSRPWTIGGVMTNFPATSHLQYDFLLTLTNEEFWPGEQTSWCCWNYNTYVKLRPDADAKALEQKILKMRDTYYIGYLQESGNTTIEDTKKYHVFDLQPVRDIHLYSQDVYDIMKRGDIRYIWLFGGVAIFILVLACINFINLSTARSANRAKEVGLRKVVGSFRSYIVRQFLTESRILSVFSVINAVLFLVIGLPYFSDLAGKNLTIPWHEWWFIPTLIATAIIVGILAGLYPSFYLSSFKPIDVLKGALSRGSKNSTMRSALVIFQFTTSIILIIGTFIIYRQMDFILNADIGYDKEQVLLLHGTNTLGNQHDAFKNEMAKLRDVEHVTISNYLPVHGTKRDQNLFWNDGKSKEEKGIGAQKWYVDDSFLSTLGMKLVAGRNFNRELASDTQSIIINKKMAQQLGLKKPLGAKIMNYETFTIIGVVDDFHWDTMRGEIGPLGLVLGNFGSIAAIKVNTADMPSVISSVTATWKKFLPHQPIRYTFLDESYAQMYDDVQRIGRIFGTFAMLAIFVACLGLFALSAFMVEQRNKEISIRLVLGASVNNIFRLLTQNFVKLVIISFVVAAPLGWYLMQLWLQDYVYKIDITWDVFALSGIIAVAIALLTVSYQSIRAALTNPASNLRSE
jgi:putative ABC transport system permease protein